MLLHTVGFILLMLLINVAIYIYMATIIVFRKNFSQLSKTILATLMIISQNKTLLDCSYLVVSVSKFGNDTTENPWYCQPRTQGLSSASSYRGETLSTRLTIPRIFSGIVTKFRYRYH